jgi:hypothetical protein
MSLRIYSWEGKVSNEPESEELPVKIIAISLRAIGGNTGKVGTCPSYYVFPVSLNLCRMGRGFYCFGKNALRPEREGNAVLTDKKGHKERK